MDHVAPNTILWRLLASRGHPVLAISGGKHFLPDAPATLRFPVN
jgi:hypothetical protein